MVAGPVAVQADCADPTTSGPRAYEEQVQPLLQRYCHDCHAQDVTEGDLDLSAFRSITDVRKDVKVWLKVREMIDSRQMPPKDADQPSDAERAQLANWVRDFLTAEAAAHAGDPGPVLLRRLSNAEYTYTIRDLAGVESLDPAREFPVDGAAGEGFTNVGSGQGMSPALVQKYLDAAKAVAEHAMLVPDGIRFSAYTSQRDQTDELMARIQAFYRRYTADGGGSPVNLQGIQFDTNQGGLLPLEKYLAATLAEREAIAGGTKTVTEVARERKLSPRYLETLWRTLTREPGEPALPLMDHIREQWRAASSGEAGRLAAEIEAWQKLLWKFNSVGQMGRADGPKSWLEPVTPITTAQEVRLKLPDALPGSDIVVYLAAADFGDGNQQDIVVWQNARIEFPAGENARQPILLRDLREAARNTSGTIASDASRAQQYLAALVQLQSSQQSTDDVARAMGLPADVIAAWAARVGLGQRRTREITGHFTEKLTNDQHPEINGWGSHQTPSLLTNRADRPITISTLTVPAHGVAVHPSPTREALVAWRSPLAAEIRIAGKVADADDKCGNGAAWRCELLSETGNSVLAAGTIDNGGGDSIQLDQAIPIKSGDVVTLAINAREGSHVCDTTHVALTLTEIGGGNRVWDLASDVVDRVLESNPLPDSHGHQKIWHFCSAPNADTNSSAETGGPLVASDSSLGQWRAAVLASKPAAEVAEWAMAVQNALTAEDASRLSEPDQVLRQRLLTGVDPKLFGVDPSGSDLPVADLCRAAPHIFDVRLPADLVAGGHFVATGVLHGRLGLEGSVQLQVSTASPAVPPVIPGAPVLVSSVGDGWPRMEAAMQEFRQLFPPALCYSRIVPVDEVVTLKLFYREDDHLRRLMLNEEETVEIDRLWDELFYVSQEPLKLAVALEQIFEFATQDNPAGVKAFAAMRQPINERAEAFRQRLIETEPIHVKAVLEFANRAWRRPLTDAEQVGLRDLYQRWRASEIEHELAIQLMLARVLTAPAFLYKLEEPAPGVAAEPVTAVELATRLSYFLWSSLPDDELRQVAESGQLTDDTVLLAQTERMLRDARIRRLAIQFACQWLHLRDFDQNDDKNESLFPEFAALRGDMYEETVQFFEDMFRRDGSVLDMLDADHAFLNESLAKHYGIGGVQGAQWQRVSGMRSQGRGGVLGMGSFLASQSGASRTSPILRGNWVFETLLGERLPRPPANVPQLPESVPDGLTARQLIERHSSDAACAKCHARIDPYGFALEQYDAIGRLQPVAMDTKTTLFDGQQIEGLDGLRDYLAQHRRHDFVRHFCRKLLGFALGRETQLSDSLLLAEMQQKLEANDFRFSAALNAIVTSPQFRDIRGHQAAME